MPFCCIKGRVAAGFRISLIAVAIGVLMPVQQGLGANAPVESDSSASRYLSTHEGELRDALLDYNRKHRVVVSANPGQWEISELFWKVVQVAGNRVQVEINYSVGRPNWGPTPGVAVFEITLADGDVQFLSHNKGAAIDLPDLSAPAADPNAPPTRSYESVEAYLREHEREIKEKLAEYNRKTRYVPSQSQDWGVGRFEWKIAGLEGDRVFLEIHLVLSNYWKDHGTGLFELTWSGNELDFVGHRDLPKKRGEESGWLAYGGERCIENYYAPNPCIGVIRAWTDFADTHGLALNPQSAKVYQAYKQNSLALGDRLMARARGLPDPTGESVFGLQAEVDALNLRQYQRGSNRLGCDLNPFSPHPCPEIHAIFQQFAERHGLPLDSGTATMLESYAQGDFKKADVIYALNQGLEVPAYGYIPTGLAGEVAALRQRFDRLDGNEQGACGMNPYGSEGDYYKPCPEVIEMWRDFAARYQLEDNAENAQVFARYAAGEYQRGDQLFAQTKGVSLEQFLEAAGVPTAKGLVIEVFPGLRRTFQKSRAGA